MWLMPGSDARQTCVIFFSHFLSSFSFYPWFDSSHGSVWKWVRLTLLRTRFRHRTKPRLTCLNASSFRMFRENKMFSLVKRCDHPSYWMTACKKLLKSTSKSYWNKTIKPCKSYWKSARDLRKQAKFAASSIITGSEIGASRLQILLEFANHRRKTLSSLKYHLLAAVQNQHSSGWNSQE